MHSTPIRYSSASLMDGVLSRRRFLKRFLCALAALGLFFGAAGQARPDFIYWSDFVGGSILRANLDGTGVTTLVTGQSNPTWPGLDLAAGQMYWNNWGTRDLRRANLDGSGQQILIPSGLYRAGPPQLDVAGGQMYWIYGYLETGRIQRANLDGTGLTTLVRNVDFILALALDVPGGKMYLSQGSGVDNNGFISRYNLDGTGREILIRGLVGPVGVALDIPRGKIYWAELSHGAFPSTVQRANLDGSGKETLVTRTYEIGFVALDVARGKVYWPAPRRGLIERANLDGTGQEILLRDLPLVGGITLQLDPIAEPVVATGYSADVISDKDPSARFAQPFHAGTFAWFESGAVEDNGAAHNDGLPAGLTFLSATGSRATYQIQPANANNVLQLSAGQTGTLTLTTPAAYSTLYVIASSGDGTPSSVGSGTINFADGSTQAFSYNSFDWCNAQGRFRPEAVLTGPNGRADVGPDGTAFVYNRDCDFQIYETIIAIDPSHSGVAIASIDFTGAPDAFLSNIFGVSGQ